MKQLFYVVLAWALTALVSWCGGKLLLRRFSTRMFRQEENVFAFLTGSVCLSMAVFAVSALHLVYRGVFLGMAILVIAAAVRARVWTPRGDSFPPIPAQWKLLFLSIWLLFGGLYLVYALAPEASPDGAAYHLALVARYARERGFSAITNNFFASLPQGMEMLFLFAFSFGRFSAAAMVHCTYLLLAPWLILNYGRRLGLPGAGVVGGLLVFLSPIAGIAGTSAYNDVALAVVSFSVFALLEMWRENKPTTLLIPIGLLAGFAFGVKYTGFIAAPYAAGFVTYTLVRARKAIFKPLLVLTLSASAVVLPTLVKNWIVVRNPASPFLNRMFPNPYVHVDFEQDMARDMSSYNITGFRDWAFDVTTTGAKTGGVLGPVFLLAPLALFALRRAPGRRVLLAALVFALPYPANLGARFLLPEAMFIATAMALALCGGLRGDPAREEKAPTKLRVSLIRRGRSHEYEVALHWPGTAKIAVLLVILQAIASWPANLNAYVHPYTWRLGDIPWRAALRIESEDQYLFERLGGQYLAVRMVERETPPGSRIYALGVPPQAYCTREILPVYYSGFNLRLRDTLYTAFDAGRQPLRTLRAQMAAQPLRGLRLVQTGSTTPVTPSIHELRVLGPQGALPPDSAWRFDAHPFPWDIGLVFDGNSATRWNAWQQMRTGTVITVDFGKMVQATGLELDTSLDQTYVQWELQGQSAAGKWAALKPAWTTSIRQPFDLRRAAIDEFKRNHIQYLLMVDDGFAAAEFQAHGSLWPMRRIGESTGLALYRFE